MAVFAVKYAVLYQDSHAAEQFSADNASPRVAHARRLAALSLERAGLFNVTPPLRSTCHDTYSFDFLSKHDRLTPLHLCVPLQRLSAAHANALEGFPAFAAAVLAALINKAAPFAVLKKAMAYLALRLLYTILYAIGGRTVGLGRSAVWGGSAAMILNIFKLAIDGKPAQ